MRTAAKGTGAAVPIYSPLAGQWFGQPLPAALQDLVAATLWGSGLADHYLEGGLNTHNLLYRPGGHVRCVWGIRARVLPIHTQPVGGVWGIRARARVLPIHTQPVGGVWGIRARACSPYTPNRLGVYGGFARARVLPIHTQPVGGVWGIRARARVLPIHTQPVGGVWGIRARARVLPIFPTGSGVGCVWGTRAYALS